MSSGFLISPFVGRVAPGYAFQPSPAEVAEMLIMPLSAQTDSGLRFAHTVSRGDVTLQVPALRYQGHIIWGATLRILDLLVASPLLGLVER